MLTSLIEWLIDTFAGLQTVLFESVVQPIAFAWGAGNLLDVAFEGTGWLLLGLMQILILVVLIGPLEKWRPVEPVIDAAGVKIDFLYTLIHRLGLFKLVMFFTFENAVETVFGMLRLHGFPTFNIDAIWPGVSDIAWVSFFLYLIVFDFVHYLIHRGQHQLNRWWALHSLHHSQRQMTMWTDNRNHLLDDVVTTLLLSVTAKLIGVGPGQFVALVVLSQLSESFQHANVKCSFGWLGDRLFVSPRFHRLHHAIGIGHERNDFFRACRCGSIAACFHGDHDIDRFGRQFFELRRQPYLGGRVQAKRGEQEACAEVTKRGCENRRHDRDQRGKRGTDSL